MSLYLLSGRFAQVGGLVVALLFGAMWLGAQTPLPVVSGISRAFVEAKGTPKDLLFVAGIDFFIFAVGTAVFALVGDAGKFGKNLHNLRR